jgi:hypothetical protein
MRGHVPGASSLIQIPGPETKVRKDTMKPTRHCMLSEIFLTIAVGK